MFARSVWLDTSLIVFQCRVEIARVVMDFSSEHISFGKREARALPGYERGACGRIAYQRHSAFCPLIHTDLTDAVEIEAVHALQG